MLNTEVKPNMRVVVGSLQKLVDANKHGLLDAAPDTGSPPLVFKEEYVLNRRMNLPGTVERPPAGHYGSGVWIICHDDGTRAVYHTTELVVPRQAPPQGGPPLRLMPRGPQPSTLPPLFTLADMEHAGPPMSEDQPTHEAVHLANSIRPERTLKFGDLTIQVFKGVAPTALRGDVLVAPLPKDMPRSKAYELPLHKAIRGLAGDYYYNELDGIDHLAPFQTVLIDARFDEERPCFGSVLFINGSEPAAEAIDKSLAAADDHGAAEVILPLREFLELPTDTDDISGPLGDLEMIAKWRGLSGMTIKLVI